MQSFIEIWQQVTEVLASSMSAVAFNTWIKCIEPLELTHTKAVFYVKNPFQRDVIESRYLDSIRELLCGMLDRQVEIKILTENEKPEPAPAADPAAPEGLSQFDYDYTFETFIVGSGNKFAHAACLAVATMPATAYNPLFIYGGSGLGKTHLLYAISNEVRKSHPDYKVVYLKGDDFTNELIDAIGKSRQSDFRNKYRYADVLLVDDIQFIGGKESTQEEFFHTFNTLFEAKKQIVLTSDRPPKEIQTLEERLRTRFEWGLIADIQAPDFETRVAIIKRKATMLNFTLPEDVTEFIATRVKNNIRQLEGAVKKIKAYNLLAGETVSVQSAQGAIRDILHEDVPVPVTVDRIIVEVGRYYNITPEDIRGKKRTSEISLARQVSMYMIREITDLSLPSIGTEFKRDHTTVLHAIRKIEEDMGKDSRLKNMISDMMKNVKEA